MAVFLADILGFAGIMEPSTSIKSAISQDLLMAIRTFISGATGSRKTNPLELTRIALDLLKRLPSARDAVLEYFCSVFDKSVSDYLAQTEVLFGL